MSLEKLKEKRAEQGFTIVELLIVIVIIGILAAIVIVAYTGITGQANDSKYKSNADAIRQVAETVNATEGNYPANVAGFSASDTAKLPDGVALSSTLVTTTAPTAANVETGEKKSPSEYSIKICASSAGVQIFYTEKGKRKSLVAGKCTDKLADES